MHYSKRIKVAVTNELRMDKKVKTTAWSLLTEPNTCPKEHNPLDDHSLNDRWALTIMQHLFPVSLTHAVVGYMQNDYPMIGYICYIWYIYIYMLYKYAIYIYIHIFSTFNDSWIVF